MEKELKISELAALWGVSVPTTWNRLNKEGLKTSKKVDNNNREVAFVIISDELINKYLNKVNKINNEDYKPNNNDNNDVNKLNNNVNNEEILSDNKLNKDYVDAEYSIMPRSEAVELMANFTSIYKENNEEIKNLYNQLSEYKKSEALLEEKNYQVNQYITENNKLKNKNNLLMKFIYVLCAVIVIFLMILTWFITFNYFVNNRQNSTDDSAKEQVINPEV